MKKLTPGEIEQESFRIIESEAGPHDHMTSQEWALVRRIIHATADFDIMKTIRLHPHALASGLSALKNGCPIYADTNMLGAGINKKAVEQRGSKIFCFVSDEDVKKESALTHETRSAIAIRKAAPRLMGGIIAIGNAPTALHEALSLCEQGKLEPALIIGMPVGFVEALESKQRLLESSCIYITNLDRKGGTPAAAAAMNALLTLAESA